MEINYGDKIYNLRVSLGYSQAAMAEKLGVKRYQISSIELNKNKPTLELITAVINIFNVKTDYFFFNNVGIEYYDGAKLQHSSKNMSDNNTVNENSSSYKVKPKSESRIIESLQDQIESKNMVIESQAKIITLLEKYK